MNPWDNDPIVAPAPAALRAPARVVNPSAPWESDEIVGEASLGDGGLELEIVGGTPVAAEMYDAPPLGEPAPPSWGGRVKAEMRGLGLGARSVLQGAGGLVGAIGGDAFNAYVMPGDQPSYRDAAGALGDMIGLPSPQDSRERVLGDVGEALSGTGLTLGAGGLLNAGRTGASLLAGRQSLINPAAGQAGTVAPNLAANPGLGARAGDILTTQPVLQAVSAAGGAGASGSVREDGGGIGAQIAAGLAGGLAPAALTAGAPMAARGIVRGGEANRQNLAAAIDDFSALGDASPTVGQGTGSRARQAAETLLGAGPTSSGVIARAGQEQGDRIGQGLQDLARSMSRNPTAEGAGRSIREGVNTFARNTKDQRRELYRQLDTQIPGDASVDLSNTQRTLAAMTAPTPGAEATTGALINPELKRIADNLAADLAASGGSGLPYEAVKGLRTRLGDEAFSFSLSPDKPTAQLRQLYGALTEDMTNVAKQAGPAAERAVSRANRYYRTSQKRLELLEDVVGRNGGPERVFNAAMQGTREGATVLRSVMRSLPPEAQKDVTAAVIKRMGMANPGQQGAVGAAGGAEEAFSAATFLTNWNRLSPEARASLFNRYGADMSRDIDRIARVAERVKEGSGVLRNPSGTAAQTAAFGYAGSLAASLMTGNTPLAAGLVTSGAFANGFARAMTNPRFVRWLARATDLPAGALPAQLNVLQRMAGESQDESLDQMVEALSAAEGGV